ncbi:2-keto-4-pentenoate hydratase [Nocardioides jensenii]|uniref:2-keto-4-pentenoate hydratase n=1 Tax=Nocardioides jensenii TaxID=1843 RepID=UPI000B05BF45|nr:hypothetical protein [Nocardioides jensenii]
MGAVTGLDRAQRLQVVAHDLWQAATDRRPTTPPSAVLGEDLDAAYQVQDLLTLRSIWAGASVRGHKVTSLDGPPCFGVLFNAMQHVGHDPLPCGQLVNPRIQAGIGFVVREDLTGREVDEALVTDAVSAVVPVLEVVDSRVDVEAPGQVDLVADNAGAARFVVGEPAAVPAPSHPFEAQLIRDGKVVADGGGGLRPWAAFAWLTRSLRERGLPLNAGELVLVGGLTRAFPVGEADWAVQVRDIGSVATTSRTGSTPWRAGHPNIRSCA